MENSILLKLKPTTDVWVNDTWRTKLFNLLTADLLSDFKGTEAEVEVIWIGNGCYKVRPLEPVALLVLDYNNPKNTELLDTRKGAFNFSNSGLTFEVYPYVKR